MVGSSFSFNTKKYPPNHLSGKEGTQIGISRYDSLSAHIHDCLVER